MLKAWLELARISNLPTAWTNVLAGWLLAGGQLQDQRILWLLLGGSLLYSGGMILNDAADAGWDREHRKERPIPRGSVSQRSAWRVGMLCLLLGAFACAVMAGGSTGLTILLVTAILLYDYCHKSWPGSVVVMGACRTLLYLVPASAVADPALGIVIGSKSLFTLSTPWFHLAPPNPLSHLLQFQFPSGAMLWICAMAIGLYIVGVTTMARQEAAGAKTDLRRLENLPVLVFAPILGAVVMFFKHGDPQVFLLAAVFVVMAIIAISIMREGGPSIGRAVGILLAGIAVVDGLAVATVSFPLGCCFVALAPLLRLWQRKIAAT